MAHIYKLKYQDKTEAIEDLKAKGCLDEDSIRMPLPTHNVVFVGKKVKEAATYDEQGNQLTAATYKPGYRVDVMDERDLDFGNNRVFPQTKEHTF